MPKQHFTPPSDLQILLKTLIESFLKQDDINAVWKLESRLYDLVGGGFLKDISKEKAERESKELAEIKVELNKKWDTGKASKVLLIREDRKLR